VLLLSLHAKSQLDCGDMVHNQVYHLHMQQQQDGMATKAAWAVSSVHRWVNELATPCDDDGATRSARLHAKWQARMLLRHVLLNVRFLQAPEA
jgi:hypothetical protein